MASNPNALKTWYAQLTPQQRQRALKLAAVTAVLAGALGLYYGSGHGHREKPRDKPKVAVIDVGEDRLEDDMRAELEKSTQELSNQNAAQNQTVQSIDARLKAQEEQNTALRSALEKMSKGGALGLPESNTLDVPPEDPAAWEKGIHRPSHHPALTSEPSNKGPAPKAIEMIGGIGVARAPEPAGGTAVDKKKAHGPRWYLPVSFMAAKLLTGLKAKTVESARGDPEPLLLRVQAPATLPNEIRAELQGCLVVAHGYGSLASERVEARLVSLNCLNAAGESVIEADITGIVVDQDGVKGLAGHPVSRMGTNLARLAFAAAIQGAGSAFSDQANTVSISPLGNTQAIDPTQIGRAASGDAASKAASEYTKIIAELVRQQAPVIEIGASKDVTVVLTQGVWLDIQPTHEGPG